MFFRRRSNLDRRTFNLFIMFATSIFIIFFAIMAGDNAEWELQVSGLSYPDGPAWDQKSETLYFSNCYGGWIASFFYGKTDTLISSDNDGFGKSRGLDMSRKGSLLVCDFSKKTILEITKKGESKILASHFEGQTFYRPNDIIENEQGNIYFTDVNRKNKNVLDGRIFFIERDQNIIRLAVEKLAYPSSLAISPVDGRLYVSETAKKRIISFSIMANDTLSDKQVFINLSEGEPQGLAFDRNGNLYVAQYGAGLVYEISPKAKIIKKIKAPGAKPTNIEFGGMDYKTLYLTEVETNSLYKRRVKIPGVK